MVDVLPRQLAHVDEAVHAAEIDEGAEADDGGDGSRANLADLEVGEEVVAGLLLVLFEVGATRQHDVVAVLVEFDDLGLHHRADIGLQIADPAKLDERGREEAAEADVDDESALDDLDDRTLDNGVRFLLGFDVAPGALVLGALLREDQTTFLVLLGEDQRLDLLTHGDDLGRVDVIADAQLAGGITPSLLYPISRSTSSRSILTTVPWTSCPSSTSMIEASPPSTASAKLIPRSFETTSRGV